MIQAFYTGLSGMQSSSSGIDIVSDNLANANTNGFRGSSYEFASLFEDALVTADSSTNSSVGAGSRLQSTPMTQTSGSYVRTDRSTDLSIFGDGWFGVQGNGAPEYTRDGAFGFDSNSDLVTADGYHVLGTMGGNIKDGVLTNSLESVALNDVGTQETLNFPESLSYPTEATTIATFNGNLGTEDEVQTMSSGVIDSQGVENELQLTYTRAENQPESGTIWDVVAVTKSLDDQTIYDTQKGSVTFDATGALVSNTLPKIDNNGTSVTIDLGTNYDGIVSIANSDVYSSSTANGIKGGELVGYDVSQDGEVIAGFTNGMQSSVGKIAVYHFQNDQGLDRVSGTRFAGSSNSGEAIFYQDANGNNIVGTDITNYQLETSNVDMTNGLTELIVLQRSYDANSKSITTADEMIQKAIEM
jgi:flagellar hook protein FlgE